MLTSDSEATGTDAQALGALQRGVRVCTPPCADVCKALPMRIASFGRAGGWHETRERECGCQRFGH